MYTQVVFMHKRSFKVESIIKDVSVGFEAVLYKLTTAPSRHDLIYSHTWHWAQVSMELKWTQVTRAKLSRAFIPGPIRHINHHKRDYSSLPSKRVSSYVQATSVATPESATHVIVYNTRARARTYRTVDDVEKMNKNLMKMLFMCTWLHIHII